MREPLLALTTLVAVFGGLWVWIGWRRRIVMRGGARDLWTSFGGAPAEVLVLAFTTPECLPCKTVQRPALEALERQHPGRIVFSEVNALEAPDLARRFGILTVPSTVIIGRDGEVRAINHGTALTERLVTQAGLSDSA